MARSSQRRKSHRASADIPRRLNGGSKIKVSDVAKRMGKSEKDLIFQLQSLGAEVTDASQVLEPEVIQALITGKKLHDASAQRHHARGQAACRRRRRKPSVRRGRSSSRPCGRRPKLPKEEPAVARAADRASSRSSWRPPKRKNAPPRKRRSAKPKVASRRSAQTPESLRGRRRRAEAPPAAAPAGSSALRAAPAATARVRLRIRSSRAAAPAAHDRRPTGPTGPRARAPQGPRPNYAGQQTCRPAVHRQPARAASVRPGAPMTPSGALRWVDVRPVLRSASERSRRSDGPAAVRCRRSASERSGWSRPRPGGPMGARPSGPGGMRGPAAVRIPSGSGRPPAAPPPSIPAPNIIRRKKEDDVRRRARKEEDRQSAARRRFAARSSIRNC